MLDRFFFDTAEQQPDAPALWVDEQLLDYKTLAAQAARISAALGVGDTLPCLIFAHRSAQAYAGILGILASGRAYVPLGAHFPIERNAAIAKRSASRTILVDPGCLPRLDELQSLIGEDYRILLIDDILNSPDAAPTASAPAITPRQPSDVAYILFTSGTTGVPKGVKISHASASAYMRAQCSLDAPVPGARYSQFFDLTFDVSVHDMFVCWANGGCLYVPPNNDPLTVFGFARTHELTHWGSVPSTASFIQQFRKLKPDSLPALRITIFCGEALPTAIALAWSEAAPASKILNLYGPTEATISCLRYVAEHDMLRDHQGGVIPLGWSYPGEETVVVDEHNAPLADGEKGELLLGGVQLAEGYISDNPKDHAKFFSHDFAGRNAKRWYRTGDIASVSADAGLVFHGRIDGQLKIRGNRIEAQEVEHAIQRASGASMVAVIPWPKDENGQPMGMVAFVSDTTHDDEHILHEAKRTLPVYAIPDKIIPFETFPVNVNGKIDKNALAQWCQQNGI